MIGFYPIILCQVSEAELQDLRRDLAETLSKVLALHPMVLPETEPGCDAGVLHSISFDLWMLSERVDRLTKGPGIDKALWLVRLKEDASIVRVMYVIRERTGMSLNDVKWLVQMSGLNQTPRMILGPDQSDKARDPKFIADLEALGCVVEWQPVGRIPTS